MFAQALVELIGTFVFLSVILTQGQPIPIAVALLTAIYFGGHVSGGHFNPAVTFMKTLEGALPMSTALVYIIVQLIGATLAFGIYKYVLFPYRT